MQSKSFSQKLLSPKTVFIAAPCLIGVTAIAALLTSMTTSRDGSPISKVSNALPALPKHEDVSSQVPASPPVIAAKPLEKTQTAIKAKTLAPKSSAPNPSSKAATGTPAGQKRKIATKAAQPSPPTNQPASPQASKQPKPAPSQSALTMQAFNPAAANDIPQVPIRVAVVRDASRFTVATSEAGVITDSQGKILGQTTTQGSIGVSAQAGGLKVGSIQSQSPIWIRPKTENGLVFVNGRWYRGFIQLISDQGRLLAVNHVEMQPYLYSVVGAEMYHSWPAEALKAQAIAARSYALVHIVRPASRYFDLGSTQRWQAYKGVGSEANSTHSAVDKTRGVVISHNGGVVESLYASSAELVREAHRGFGMSQYGARDLANQNLNYRQILSRFYPGTDLSLLQAQ